MVGTLSSHMTGTQALAQLMTCTLVGTQAGEVGTQPGKVGTQAGEAGTQAEAVTQTGMLSAETGTQAEQMGTQGEEEGSQAGIQTGELGTWAVHTTVVDLIDHNPAIPLVLRNGNTETLSNVTNVQSVSIFTREMVCKILSVDDIIPT